MKIEKNYISYTYYVCYVGLHNTYCKSGQIVFGKIRYDESKSRQDGRCYERSGSADGDYTVTVTTGGKTETNANIYINGGERVKSVHAHA